jgi:dihydrofolate reductase
MGKVVYDVSISLDGFVAGPNQSVDHPLGEGGEQLHSWLRALSAWRDAAGLEGGDVNESSAFVNNVTEGAAIMGRNMFGGGPGPWGENPWNGWWGSNPPFHLPVFVLTHHARPVLELDGDNRFTFVTDGIYAALEQARRAAGDRDVAIYGGGHTAAQYLQAGLVDEVQMHLAPVLLRSGVRLFDLVQGAPLKFEQTAAVEAPGVVHLHYTVHRV